MIEEARGVFARLLENQSFMGKAAR
jgi:hypothetical protein